MLELDRLIDAAVGEAPSADIERVNRIVTRRRRRRVLTRTAAVGGLIVAIGAFLWVPREGSRTLITTQGTAAPTTPSSVVGITDLSTGDLRRRLEAIGHTVRVLAPSRNEFTMLGVRPATWCIDKVRVLQVYEYESAGARMTWSRAISRDGGSIRRGTVIREILWAAPPHFFARGKVIVLYVGGDGRLINDLVNILGPTIDPGAPHGGNTHEQPC
jgi:hypothetical protein